MNEYRELIDSLREEAEAVMAIEWEIPICTSNHILQAADAIEQLARERDVLELQNHLERCEHAHTRKERDAAVADLASLGVCQFCKHDKDSSRCLERGRCTIEDNWEWRGLQEESSEEVREACGRARE